MSRVPPVDPLAPQSLPVRSIRGFIRTKAGTKMAMALSANVDPWLLKTTNGHFATGVGFPVVNLTTTGRKSGEPRTATLVYFTQGDDVILIASSFGRDKHPAWYLNLKSDPHAELLARGKGGAYTAREADEPARSQLFALAEKVYSGYGQYAASAARTIPVMILSPSAA
jgi:deazaflavin-dependent oxidoreductase (nitroreductase family)